ncbi:hypothetical protein BC835DRAFT_1454864 [Cytidiella melzeri]|nr:hypothetical protein BC835DRAFT_1454864 [Cytidiella melzeri]
MPLYSTNATKLSSPKKVVIEVLVLAEDSGSRFSATIVVEVLVLAEDSGYGDEEEVQLVVEDSSSRCSAAVRLWRGGGGKAGVGGLRFADESTTRRGKEARLVGMGGSEVGSDESKDKGSRSGSGGGGGGWEVGVLQEEEVVWSPWSVVVAARAVRAPEKCWALIKLAPPPA